MTQALQCEVVDFSGNQCSLAAGHAGDHRLFQAGPPPVAPPATPAQSPTDLNLAAALVLVGGILVAVGAFLPWVTAVLPLVGTISRSGMEGGDGPILLGTGALIALVGASRLRSAGPSTLHTLLIFVALGALALTGIEYQSVDGRIAKLEADGTTAWVGMGIYAMGAGAVAAIIGAVALARKGKPIDGVPKEPVGWGE